MARNPNAWLIPSEIEPAFDGGFIQNQFIKGTLFIFQTNAQKLALKKLYRIQDNETTTMCYVVADSAMYYLNNPVDTETTQESDWTAVGLGTGGSDLKPVGEWSASTGQVVDTGHVLQDTDAVGVNGEYYIVKDSPSGTTQIYPGLFRGVSVTVYNDDFVISVGGYYAVLRPTVTWETLNKPQVIDDYVNGIVIPHVHLAADISDLPALLATKIDRSEIASIVENNLANITDAEIVSVGFLRKWVYFKDETYSKAQVDALIQLNSGNQNFDGNRPINRIPEVGEILGTDTLLDWSEEGYYGVNVAEIVISSIDAIQIGELISPTVKGQLNLKDYDSIVSITVYDDSGTDVGNPPFVPTDKITDIDFQVNTPIIGVTPNINSYRIEAVVTKDSNNITITTETLEVTTVHPILYGVGAADLNITDKYLTLQKLNEIDGNKTVIVNSNSNKIYYCIPEEYANRVAVIDNGGSDVLGSLFPATPVIEQVTSDSLAANWTYNYKVYQANYDTDSSNITLTFVLDREDALDTGENTLDDILEGNVNKHLTKSLKEKLVNFNGADYLPIATYDPNSDGIVGKASQLAVIGKNTTGSIIPAFNLVTFSNLNLSTGEVSISLADKDSGVDARAMTLENIADNSTGAIMVRGVAAPIDTSIHQLDDDVYLDSSGNYTFDRPLSGLIQPVGRVITVGVFGALYIEPQPKADLNSTIENWQALRSYEKNTVLIVPTNLIDTSYPLGYTLFIRTTKEYTSSSTPENDLINGDIEIIGGDMYSKIYDPRTIRGDVYDMDNMEDGLTEIDPAIRKVTITENQRIKLDGLQPSTFKGIFTDPTALRTAFPSSNDGDSANVTSTSTTWAWNSALPDNPPTVGGDWEDTLQGSGGDMKASIYDNAGKGVNVYNVDNHDDGVTNKVYTATEKTKLSNIEDNATSDQTALEIKTAYESNADTNAFLNAEKTKLSTIEDGATADQNAVDVPYDNVASGLVAVNTQAAIDEIDNIVDAIPSTYLDKATYDSDANGVVDKTNSVIVSAVNSEATNMVVGDVVYIDSVDGSGVGQAKFSTNNNPSTLPIVGIVLNDGVTTSFPTSTTITIGIKGVFKIPSFGGFAANETLYIGLAGKLQNTIPAIDNNTTIVLVAHIIGVLTGDFFINIVNLQIFKPINTSFDVSSTLLTQTNVQAALEEAGDAAKGSISNHLDVDISGIQLGDRLEWDGNNLIPYRQQEFIYSYKPVTTSNLVTFTEVLNQTDTYIGGNYKIEIFYHWNHANAGNDFVSRIFFDGTVLFDIGSGLSHKQEPKDSGGNVAATGSAQQIPFSAATFIPISAGARNLTIDFSTETGGANSSIWDILVHIKKIN